MTMLAAVTCDDDSSGSGDHSVKANDGTGSDGDSCDCVIHELAMAKKMMMQ